MTDNREEKNIDNSEDIQFENPSNEIELSKDTEAIIPNQETENMEVHKHPHHVTHKKKWAEYLLEFSMLFLAVFLGFLAENQREHFVENKREKKYAIRLLSDLKEDTIFLNKRIKNLEDEKTNYAAFLAVMTSNLKDNPVNIMKTADKLSRGYTSLFTTTTYDQMKTSGSLRYVKNDSLTTDLQKYYEILIPKASKDANLMDVFFMDNIAPYYIKHFKFQNFDSDPTLTEKESELINRTAESDQELINLMGIRNEICGQILRHQKTALEASEKLIKIIKKEYNLK